MKTFDMRKTDIQSLVVELQEQRLHKRDLVVPSQCLSVKDGLIQMKGVTGTKELDQVLSGLGISTAADEGWKLGMMKNAHSQICEKLNIPRKYYDMMREERNRPNGGNHIFDETLSYWFRQMDSNYFVRTFVNEEGGTGYFRALLGDNYKVIDHMDVLIGALEAVKESGVELKIEYADLTEEKMYVRFICPGVEVFSPELVGRYRTPGRDRGDGGSNGICSGFVLSNSEVGQGKFSIAPRAVVGACANGMIFTDESYKRMHMGSKMEEYSFIKWSEETRRLDTELILSQVKDAVKTFCSPEYLGKQIARLEEEGGIKLEHPIDAVKNVSRFLEIPEERINTVLGYFMEGGDTRRFGISQALTYYAHHDADADTQYQLETQAIGMLPKMGQFDKPEVIKKRQNLN